MSASTRPKSSIEQNLPAPIVATLKALARRIRVVLLLRGVLALAAAALATLLTLMAVDAGISLFGVWQRIALTACGAGVLCVGLFVWLIRPMRRRISLAAIARVVERQHPEIQERISSTVELRGGSEIQGAATAAELPRGSEQLIAALSDEATLEAGRLTPRREVTTRTARPYLYATLGLAAVLALLFLLWPREIRLAMARVLAPLANLDNLPAAELEVSPGDCVVAVGDPLSIRVEGAEGSLADAQLEEVDATGYVTRASGTAIASTSGRQTVAWSFPAVMDSFQYRVRAGRALSRYYTVTAAVRPKLESAQMRYDYPDYSGVPPKTVPELPKLVEALGGTQATLVVSTNVRVAAPRLHTPWLRAVQEPADAESPSKSPPSLVARSSKPRQASDSQGAEEMTYTATEAVDPQTGRYTYSWSFPIEPETSGAARLEMLEEHGIAGEPNEFEIHALPDRRPTVAIVEPNGYTVKLRPNGRLPLVYVAEDDFGIAEAEMLIRVGQADPIVVAQPSPAAAGKPVTSLRGTAALEMSQLDLADATRVTVQMRVADTLPASRHGPNRATSLPIVIEIDRSAEPLAQDDRMNEEARQAQERADAAAEQAERLRELADRQRELAQEAADPDARHLPQAMWQQDQRELAHKVAELVQQDPRALAEELKAQQKQAAELAQEARKLAERQQWLQRETDVAAQQQPDRERLKRELLEELARQQKAIADDTAKLQAESPAPKSEAAKELASAGEAAKKTAEEIQRQQVEPAATDARQSQKTLEKAAAAESAAAQTPTPNRDKPEPGKTDSAKADAGKADAGKPDAGKPDSAKSDAGKTDSTQPQSMQPDPSKSDSAKSDSVKSDAAKSDAAKSDAAKSDAAQPDAAKPDAGKSAASKPDSAKSDASKPDAAKPDAAKSDAAKPDSANADASKTDAAKPDAAKPDAAKTDAAKTDAAKTDAAKPDAAKTDAAKTEPAEAPRPPVKPGEQPSRAERARNLAARQASVAEALESLSRGETHESLAPVQEGVEREADRLQERTDSLNQRAGELGLAPKAREQGERASRELNQAAQSANEAAEALSRVPATAREPERRAEQSLRNAADALGSMENALREQAALLPAQMDPPAQASQAQPQPGQHGEAGKPADALPVKPAEALAAGMEQANEAAQTRDARQAAESAGEASRALQAAMAASQAQAAQWAQAAEAAKTGAQAARAQAAKSGKTASQNPAARPSPNPGSQSGKTGKIVAAPGSKLEPVAVKPKSADADWIKFRGQVQRDVGQQGNKDGDDEYRELVNRYFEELSRQGGKR